jgi:hypothetical protein
MARIDHAERDRRRKLVQAHMAAENAHDLEAIIDTFAGGAEMVFNKTPFTGDGLRMAHILFGMSGDHPGSLSGTQVRPEGESFTDDEIVIDGTVTGLHVGDVLGFPATQRQVVLPYVAIYRFDAEGKLVSERIVMDFSPFAGIPA